MHFYELGKSASHLVLFCAIRCEKDYYDLLWQIDNLDHSFIHLFVCLVPNLGTGKNFHDISHTIIEQDLEEFLECWNMSKCSFCMKGMIDQIQVLTLYKEIKLENSMYDARVNNLLALKKIEFYNKLCDFIVNKKRFASKDVKNVSLIRKLLVPQEMEPYESCLVTDWEHINQEQIDENIHRQLHTICHLLKTHLNIQCNVLDYIDLTFQKCIAFSNYQFRIIERHSLKNVFYYEKYFYDEVGQVLSIDFMNEDAEYYQTIEEHGWGAPSYESIEVSEYKETDPNKQYFFLDYCYDFYNFGEFWDVMKRAIHYRNLNEVVDNECLIHKKFNKINEIEYYFEKLGFQYPSELTIASSQTEPIHLHNVTFSIIKNAYRGCVDEMDKVMFQKYFCKDQEFDETKRYILYLKRGPHGRGIVQEEELIAFLREKTVELQEQGDNDNVRVIVIDGSESLKEMIEYWMHCVFVIGCHGSLFKNMIFARRYPVCFELSPKTRHPCFYDNAIKLNFPYFYVTCDSHEDETLDIDSERFQKLKILMEMFLNVCG